MPMSWKSLGLLRENLGDIGEGVTSYIKGRQEEERRRQQHGALKSFLATGEGQRLDPAMAELAFPSANYDALGAIRAMTEHKTATAPSSQVVGSARTGYRAINRDPLTGKMTPGETILDPEPEDKATTPVHGLDEEDLVYLASSSPDPAKRLIAQNTLREIQKRRIEIARAQAGIREDVDTRKNEREATEKTAITLGERMVEQQKIITALTAELERFKGRDGKPVDRYFDDSGRKRVRSEVERKLSAARNAWQQYRAQLNEIKHKFNRHVNESGVEEDIEPGKPLSMNGGWQDWNGYQVRMLG